MVELNTKVNTDYVVSSCWRLTRYLFLEKVLRKVLISFPIETWTQPLLIVAVDVYGVIQFNPRGDRATVGGDWRRHWRPILSPLRPRDKSHCTAQHPSVHPRRQKV